MGNEASVIRSRKYKIGIGHIFLIYWGVLVAWQNITRATARSGADLLLKMGLLLMLIAFYMLRTKRISNNILPIFVFAIYMLISYGLSEDGMSANVILAYSYPVLLSLLAFGFGNDFEISKKELLFFLKGVIWITAYAAIYAVIFQREYFTGAFSLSQAYGSELTSFFISSHEYGMYLMYAIVACMVCIEVEKSVKKLPYVLAILLFIPNLILTFSRTTIVAICLIALVYCFISANSKLRKWVIFAVVFLVLLAIFSEETRDFLELIAFKKQDREEAGGRFDLMATAMEMFGESDFLQKLFGDGVMRLYWIKVYTDHDSVHNAYLQVLLQYGVIGLTFFVGILLAQLKTVVGLYKEHRFYSVTFIACLVSGMMLMATNTAIIFTSPIDSFFLTVFAVLVPKYVRNSIVAGTFEEQNEPTP